MLTATSRLARQHDSTVVAGRAMFLQPRGYVDDPRVSDTLPSCFLVADRSDAF
jgi:hypothetical protein